MKFEVNGQCIKILDSRLTVSGTLNYYEDEFAFDESWDGFTKTVVYAASEPVAAVMDGNKARVPYTVLEHTGYIKVGVFGVKTEAGQTVRKPTVYSDVIFVEQGCQDGVIIPDPDPSVYEQILAIMAETEAMAVEAAQSASEAAQSASEAAESAAQAVEDIAALTERVTEAEGDIESLEGRMQTAEGDIDGLEDSKADKSDTYTKTEVDSKFSDLTKPIVYSPMPPLGDWAIWCRTEGN